MRELFSKSWSSDIQLDGKTAIVTGANTGIGKETAKDLAKPIQNSARVILACRDLLKAEQAASDISRDVENAIMVVRKLERADTQSIYEFAELIYNRHFFLTFLLMDLLKHSAPSSVINVSSLAHSMGKIHFEDLNSEKGYHPVKAYVQSKLPNILFTRELATRVEEMRVSVYAVDPGLVKTDIIRHLKKSLQLFVKTRGFLIQTPAEGAYNTLYCALTPDLPTGIYYSNCAMVPYSPAGDSLEMR
ncbi:retinol dehydrogenase 12-like [Cyprinus carpio]|uniref:Retinol dehydrogenase 12-like n=1 Tax=Cyprinus carpio TaxID=7962 RepID=A0A9Q9VTD7_CYPCA|nr:retinol dehydrogenase 12-like [Cyprinus carpio]